MPASTSRVLCTREMDDTYSQRFPASQHTRSSQFTGSTEIIDLTEDNELLPISFDNLDSDDIDLRSFFPTEFFPAESNIPNLVIQPSVLPASYQDFQRTQPALTTRQSQLQLNNNGKRGRDDGDFIESNGNNHTRLFRNEQNYPDPFSLQHLAASFNAQAPLRQESHLAEEPTNGEVPTYAGSQQFSRDSADEETPFYLGSRPLRSQDSTRQRSGQPVLFIDSNGTAPIRIDGSQPDVQVTATRRVKKKHTPPSVINHSKRRLPIAHHNGVVCQPSKSVELQDGTFMRIKAIYEDQPGNFMLVGTVFTRIDRFRLLPTRRLATEWKYDSRNLPDTRFDNYSRGRKRMNELIQRVLAQDGEGKDDFGLWRRPIQDVKREIMLNLIDSYDEDSYLYDDGTNAGNEIYDDLGFICRWREVRLHDEKGEWKEQRVERIPRKELDEPQQIPQQNRSDRPRSTRSYTFVDAFCSAGGISTGARQAGLQIKYAFDKDDNKMATYVLNFGDLGGGARAIDVCEFIEYARTNRIRVDVLHLSPPCQPFSQANTTPNEQKNEMNQSPIFACCELLKILKPRVVTVEEAPGMRIRHEMWFNALVEQFTSIGYSLRWKLIKCADFGVPQTRKRLMIMAAAHGEDLPPFPEPTHMPGECSVRQTLWELERYARTTEVSHNRPASTRIFQPKPAYDANGLANTITTSGGSNYHPSGLRDFTIREYAALQTFPFQFGFGTRRDFQEFSLQELKTQIGNAVPPAVAAAIYRCVIRSLNKSDERALTLNRARDSDSVIEL